MNSTRLRSITLVAVLLGATPAHAIWFRTSSLEWQTDLADLVVVGRVEVTKSIKPLNKYYDSQQVTCKVVEAVKGEWSKLITFRQDYRRSEKPLKSSAGRMKKGERILLILYYKGSNRETLEVENWMNLSDPAKKTDLSRHAAYNNECKLLANENSILKVVRKRAREKRKPKRGLIVPFQPGGYTHDFVITAEPEFKQRFIDQLRSKYHDTRCDAIFNLVSYPSTKTRQLIRPLLKDSATTIVRNYHGEGQDITYYPVRQAAYVALALLDDKPPLPKPFFDKIMPSMFETGFESEVYFSRGNWKRLKEIADPPPKFPFGFLKEQKPVTESHDWRTLDYTYAFQADFTVTRKAVEKELLPKGFQVADDDPQGFGRKWRSVEYKRGNELVIIFQHMRYKKSPQSVVGVDIKGWVSFQVRLERTIGSRPQKPVSNRR